MIRPTSGRAPRPGCVGCGGRLWSHSDSRMELVDLPAFGRLVRHKQLRQR